MINNASESSYGLLTLGALDLGDHVEQDCHYEEQSDTIIDINSS